MATNKKTRIDYILRKGKSFETQIQNLVDYLDNENADVVGATLRLNTVSALHKEYIVYHDELLGLDDNDEYTNRFLGLQDSYYNAASRVSKLQSAQNTSMGETTFFEKQKQMKLPDVDIPTFDGSMDAWLSFKDGFNSMVDSRTDINDLIKLAYLKKALKGEAFNKISIFTTSAENYKKAWTVLTEAYEKKRILMIRHIDAILDFPVAEKATAAGLSKLVDDAKQHMHMLELLNMSRDDFIVRVLEKRLPTTTRRRWEDSLTVDKMPTLNDFYTFIQSNVFKMHAIEENKISETNKRRTADSDFNAFKAKRNKTTMRSLVTKAEINCYKCNNKHPLSFCPIFQKMDVQARWDFIRERKLCRNCLHAHKDQCKSDKRCKTCAKAHHSMLHSNKNITPTSSQVSTVASPSADTPKVENFNKT